MCSHYNLKANPKEIEDKFNAEFEGGIAAEISIYANGYAHPKMPVITNDEPGKIKLFHWGLIPSWVKDSTQAKEMANMCIMAKIETIEDKPSFRDSAKHKRCIIPATSFYEWKWLDPKGKHKEKYEISLADNELYAFGGLWSNWTNKDTGVIIETFSLVTTSANELMAEIHNTKKRMPIMLKSNQISDWLNFTSDFNHFSDIAHHQHLSAHLIEPHQSSMFL